MSTESKKLIKIGVYNKGKELNYTGRLLGLLSDKEYAAIIDTASLRKKLLTVPTTPLSEIASIPEKEIPGFRIAIAVKKREEDDVMKKVLFITEPIDFVSGVNSEKDVTFVGTDGSYIIVDEEEA